MVQSMSDTVSLSSKASTNKKISFDSSSNFSFMSWDEANAGADMLEKK